MAGKSAVNLSNLWLRLNGRYQRTISAHLFQRPFEIKQDIPLISFTFDDFPTSALLTGGTILRRYGFVGTYYASFALMRQNTPVGTIFSPEHVETLLEEGHELGCHTFAHCHSWETRPSIFRDSVIENA